MNLKNLVAFYQIKEIGVRHMMVFDWVRINIPEAEHSNLIQKVIENCRFFPTIAEIRALVEPSDVDKAAMAANRLARAVKVYPNVRGASGKARDEMGELAWRLCEQLGGIFALHDSHVNGRLNIDIAERQWEKLAKAMIAEEKTKMFTPLPHNTSVNLALLTDE